MNLESVEQTFAEWGQTLGLNGLRFNDRNILNFSSAEVGSFYAEPIEEDILVYLLRDLPQLDQKTLLRALQLTHPKERYPRRANTGLRREDRLGFFVRLPGWQLQPQDLDQAFQQLCHMHNRLR